MANANGKRRSHQFIVAGWREWTVKLDPETADEVNAYADEQRLARQNALADLVELGLETLRQDKRRGMAEVVNQRNQRRIVRINHVFEFERDCFGCGARGTGRRINGHVQCTACGCILETCCDL